jgi:tetratricopeptide (TPR) repeat protein
VDKHEAYNNWGNALQKLGDLKKDEALYNQACEKYALAVKYKADYPQAHGNWGIALMNSGREQEAKKKFLISLELFGKQGRDKDVKKVEDLLKELEGKRSTD